MKRALIIDTETTGLSPDVDRCIEVGCILYDLELAAPVVAYSSLIGQVDPSNGAEAINRIAPSLIKEAPNGALVWGIVEQLVKSADVVLAHRAEFDRGFVPAELRTVRPWCCTKFHVEWPLGKVGDHLVHLALAHGVGILAAHRALTDCDILARLLTRVAEMGHDLDAMLTRAMRPRVRAIAHVSYDDREKAKAAGFSWDGAKREWWREMPIEDVGALPFRTSTEECGL